MIRRFRFPEPDRRRFFDATTAFAGVPLRLGHMPPSNNTNQARCQVFAARGVRTKYPYRTDNPMALCGGKRSEAPNVRKASCTIMTLERNSVNLLNAGCTAPANIRPLAQYSGSRSTPPVVRPIGLTSRWITASHLAQLHPWRHRNLARGEFPPRQQH